LRTILPGNVTGFIGFALPFGGYQAFDQRNVQDWAQGPTALPLLQRWLSEVGPEEELQPFSVIDGTAECNAHYYTLGD